MAFLDTTGLERLWQHIVSKIGSKADVDHTHSEYATKEYVNEQPVLNLDYITDTEHLISSGDDMNNYTTSGVYRCATAAIAASLSNITSYVSSGFRLIVSATSSTKGVIQIAIFNTSSAPRIYWRVQSNDGTWGSWYRMGSIEYGSAAYVAGTTALPTGSVYFQYE